MTTDRRNFLPSDAHTETMNDLWLEAQHWMDGIANEAEAEAVEKLLKLAREAEAAANKDRDIEKEPHETALAEVRDRYRPILDRAELIKAGCKSSLTDWRKKIAAQQEAVAAEQRRIADNAKAEAARIASVARGNLGAMEIAKGAAETAARFEKTTARMERKAGKGLRMRTVRKGSIVDLRVAIGHYYRTNQDAMRTAIQAMVDHDTHNSSTAIPGVEITESKEAF